MRNYYQESSDNHPHGDSLSFLNLNHCPLLRTLCMAVCH